MSEAFDLHWDRGWEFYKAGKFEEALTEWREASKLDPNDALTRRNIGTMLSQLGQKEAAIMKFREAVRLQPDYEDAHQSLVHGLMKTDRSAEALAAVHEALVACPDSSTLYSYLGSILRVEANKTKDNLGWEAAAAAFQQATNLDPTSSNALHSLGVLNWKLGKKREAVTASKAAVALDPNNLKALDQLGRYQARTGNLLGVFRTVCAIVGLPETEEKQQYVADTDSQQIVVLLVGAGLAAVLVGAVVWKWQRRR